MNFNTFKPDLIPLLTPL